MKAKKILLSCALSLVAATAIGGGIIALDHSHDTPTEVVNEHSGGLDQCGGHNNRKYGGYHYHRTPRC